MTSAVTTQVEVRPRLRSAVPEDREFLLRVYESTRIEEFSAMPWDDATRAVFLRMQAEAQDVDYRHRPEAVFLVVTFEATDVGRLYRSDTPGEIRLMDIALLPEWRGRGMGTALLRDLLAEADEQGLKVTLHVEHRNPARRLYARLGFTSVGQDDVYQLLERSPRGQIR